MSTKPEQALSELFDRLRAIATAIGRDLGTALSLGVGLGLRRLHRHRAVPAAEDGIVSAMNRRLQENGVFLDEPRGELERAWHNRTYGSLPE